MDKNREFSSTTTDLCKIEYAPDCNKHIVSRSEYFGQEKLTIKTSSGRIYKLTIKIYCDVFGFWEITKCVTNIKCNYDIMEDVKRDLETGNFIWNNADTFYFYKRSGRYWQKCMIVYNGDYENNDVNYLYDKSTNEYTFFVFPNTKHVQTLKASITSKEFIKESNFYKKRITMEYDITEDMKNKYGDENVEKVSIEYHAENFKFPI